MSYFEESELEKLARKRLGRATGEPAQGGYFAELDQEFGGGSGGQAFASPSGIEAPSALESAVRGAPSAEKLEEFASLQATADALGEDDSFGDRAKGALTWALDKLDITTSAGVAAIQQNLGFDPDTGEWDVTEVGGIKDLFQMGEHLVKGEWDELKEEESYFQDVGAALQGKHYSWGDKVLAKDEDDNWAEKALKTTGAFVGDVLSDPLTYATFGTSALAKKGLAEVANAALEGTAKRATTMTEDFAAEKAADWGNVQLRKDAAAELAQPVDEAAGGLADDATESLFDEAPIRETLPATGRITTEPKLLPSDKQLVDQLVPDAVPSLRDRAASVIAEEAAEAVALKGTRGLQQYLDTLPADLAEELRANMPKELRAGLRVGLGKHQVRLTDGKVLDRVGLGKVVDARHKVGNKLRTGGIGRKVADRMSGQFGATYGEYLEGALKNPEKANRIRYGQYARAVEVERSVGQLGRELDVRASAGVMTAHTVLDALGVEQREAGERAMRKYFNDPTLEMKAGDAVEEAGWRAAAALRQPIDQVFAQAKALNLAENTIEDYAARIITDDYKNVQNAARLMSLGGRSGKGGAAPLKSRSAFNDLTEDGGPEWWSNSRINKVIQERHGVDAVETDPWKVSSIYLTAMNRAVAEASWYKRMADNGLIAVDAGKARKLLDKGGIQSTHRALLAQLDEDEAFVREKIAGPEKVAESIRGKRARLESELADAESELARINKMAADAEVGGEAVDVHAAALIDVDNPFAPPRAPFRAAPDAANLRAIAREQAAEVQRRADRLAAHVAGQDERLADITFRGERAGAQLDAIAAERELLLSAAGEDKTVAEALNLLDPEDVEGAGQLLEVLRTAAEKRRDRLVEEQAERAARGAGTDPKKLDNVIRAQGDLITDIGRRIGMVEDAPQRSDAAQFLEEEAGWQRALQETNYDKGRAPQFRGDEEKALNVLAVPAIRELVDRRNLVVKEAPTWYSEAYQPMFSLFKTWATVGRGPGYHARNGIGAAVNNWIGGVKGADYSVAKRMEELRLNAWLDLKKGRVMGDVDDVPEHIVKQRTDAWEAAPTAQRQMMVDAEWRRRLALESFDAQHTLADVEYWMRAQNSLDSDRLLEDAVSNGTTGRNLFGDEVEDLNRVQRGMNRAADNAWINRSAQAARNEERYFRTAAFVSGLRRFGTDADGRAAGVLVKNLQFDYTDLSDFERKYMKNLIPFYTFTRHNLPLQLRAMVSDPGKVSNMLKLHESLGEFFDAEENPYAPQWQEDKFGFQLPADSWLSRALGGNEDKPITLMMESPTTELNKWLLAPGADMGDWSELLRTGVVSNFNPLIKSTVESFTGVDPSTGAKNDGRPQTAANWVRWIDGIAPGTPLTRQTAESDEPVLADGFGWLGTVLPDVTPPLGQVQRLIPLSQDTKSAERLGTSWGSNLFGLPVATMTQDQVDGEMSADIARMEDELDEPLGELGITRRDLSDYRRKYGDEGLAAALASLRAGQ